MLIKLTFHTYNGEIKVCYITICLFVYYRSQNGCVVCNILANVSILGKERVPGVGKLGWRKGFDTGFKIN